MPLETKEDIIQYLEAEIQVTEALVTSATQTYINVFTQKEAPLTDQMRHDARAVLQYMKTVLIPVLRGELQHNPKGLTK